MEGFGKDSWKASGKGAAIAMPIKTCPLFFMFSLALYSGCFYILVVLPSRNRFHNFNDILIINRNKDRVFCLGLLNKT